MAYSFYPACVDQQRPPQGPPLAVWPIGAQPGMQPPALVARILVSEDDPSIQRIYASLLPPHGFELITVPGGDGPLTVALAQRFMPDLLITDVNKPGLDGPGICRALRADERTADLPLLMVTAMEEWVERRRGAMADDYMVKPFSFEGLIYRITTLLSLRRAARVQIARRVIMLPDDEVAHPVTGLLGPQALHRLLPALTARPGWAIAGLRIERFAGLVRAHGRPLADSLLLRLASIVQAEAGHSELVIAHTGLDASLILAGPSSMLGELPERIVERFAVDALRRMRSADGPLPMLKLSRLDFTAGPVEALPDLIALL